MFDDWDNQLRGCVTHLRALSGLEPDAPDLAEIVGELVLKALHFARLWDRYDVRAHTRGHKIFHHPEVGDLSLGYQGMQLNGTSGQTLVVYYAGPGTPEHDALTLAGPLAKTMSPTGPRTTRSPQCQPKSQPDAR